MKPGGGALETFEGARLRLLGFSFLGLDENKDDLCGSFLLRELLEPFLLVVLAFATLTVSLRGEERELRGGRAAGDLVPWSFDWYASSSSGVSCTSGISAALASRILSRTR